MTTLIKNGTIITATDTYKADIMVKNGIISEIGTEISKIANEIIDAKDKWVLPGGVDVHTHMDVQYDGMTTVDDFETGTAAAAAGGTTTVIDYAEQTPGASLAGTLEAWKKKAESHSIIDYAFHVALCEVNESILGEIPALVEAGVTSFLVRLDGCENRFINDAQLLEFLQHTSRAGALPCIHAENGEIIKLYLSRLQAQGRTSVKNIPCGRPPEVEAQAVARAISIAEMAKAPIYLSSLSSAHAIEKVKAARDRGLAVFAETSPHHLVMSSEKYESPEGIKYYCAPPLRPSWHADVLWKAIASSDIHVVGSDHRAFNYAGQKDLGKDNFLLAPRGFPGIQERLSVLCSAGVRGGKISANRFVELASTFPAKLFGLFPRKGALAVGSDADVIIYDPKAEITLSKDFNLSRSDYTPYEGMKVRGSIWLVLQRGKIIARENKITVRAGEGEFLSCAKFSLP
ncbi:MAG TPA: dihydropyrimidinase [Acidobacteriota bacterium]|nr:dihydropyrimidinase [Acidobacteriota bacterium]